MALTKVTMGLLKDLAAKVMDIMANHSNIFSETKVATGAFLDFAIPAGVKRITVVFDGVSTNGTSLPLFQLGDASAFKISGYDGTNSVVGTGVASTRVLTGFAIGVNSTNWTTVVTCSGALELYKVVDYKWVSKGVFGTENNTGIPCTYTTAGSVELPNQASRIRVTTVNGTDLFDAGQITVSWEF